MEMMKFARYSNAGDLRDKVYAVLNMSHTTASMVDVDYSEGNSVVDVYTAFACQKTLMGQTERICYEILYYAGLPNAVPGLPSWVPDWSMVQQHAMMPFAKYHCNDGQKPTFTTRPKSATAQTQGKIIDTVLFKSVCCAGASRPGAIPLIPNEPYTSNLAIFAPRIESLTQEFLVQHVRKYPSGEKLEDVVRRTLTLDLSLNGHDRLEAEDDEYKRAYQGFCEEVRGYPGQLDRLSSNAERKQLIDEISEYMSNSKGKAKWWDFVKVISVFQAGRCICITKNDYVACLPNAVEVRDLVVVFQGARIPFILRPCEGVYLFVGYGYVHGIMDGIPQSELERYPTQTFLLK